ncbi:WhiB family transcriptional regulator [Streptomyces sp. NPDC023838]|uniref:WhiB family transcriptional regulator n=1 Tax=Streptomyces sp. NPDC023838 TaxID=3154325 RepID=UPI0033E2F693
MNLIPRHAPDAADPRDDWRHHGGCLEPARVDPEVMFPGRYDPPAIRRAKTICLECPVKAVCLRSAMDEEGGSRPQSRSGVRGGLTEHERSALARRLGQGRALGKRAAA